MNYDIYSAYDIFNYLKDNLKIEVVDATTPVSCGGEVEGNHGVKVKLLLCNPFTDNYEEISSSKCDL